MNLVTLSASINTIIIVNKNNKINIFSLCNIFSGEIDLISLEMENFFHKIPHTIALHIENQAYYDQKKIILKNDSCKCKIRKWSYIILLFENKIFCMPYK